MRTPSRSPGMMGLVGLFLLAPPGAGAEAPASSVRVLAVGDTGDKHSVAVASALRSRAEAERTDAIVFLGDNFYTHGLNLDKWQKLVTLIMDPFRPAIAAAGGPTHVHAVAGNHDYYARTLLGIQKYPIGFTTVGNEREKDQKDLWQYHYGSADDVILKSPDGTVGLQIVFFDSARPVARCPCGSADLFERLRTVLLQHREDPGVQWRIVVAHHPLETVGKHGNLGRPSGPFKRFTSQLLGGQDANVPEYRAYRRHVLEAIKSSGARVNAFVAGHDHSLQLLNRAPSDCPACPSVHVVSGSGAEQTPVAVSAGTDYTAVTSGLPRESPRGFVEMKADAKILCFKFYREGANPTPLPMGSTGSKDVTEFGLGVSATTVTTTCDQ